MTVKQVLSQRYVKRFLAARLISSFGNGMSPIALAFGILHLRGGSTSELGWVLGSATIAMMVMAPFGGVIADKFGRVRVVGICDIWGSLGLFVQAGFFATGHVPIWVFLFANINFGLSWGVFWPASSGVLPAICRDEALQKANSLQNFISNGSMIAGAAVGGYIVSAWGATTGLFIDAATFTTAGILVFSFGHVVAKRAEDESSMLDDLLHGWRVFLSYRWIVLVVAGTSFLMMAWAMGENILGPLIAINHFHGAKSWALVLTAESVGYLVGSLIGLRLNFTYPMRWMAALMSVLALYLFTLAHPHSLLLIALSAFVWGIALDIISSVWMTALAREVPREALSRVSSFDALGSYAFRPVGLIIAGPLATAFGIAMTLNWATALVVAIAVLLLCVPQVRNMKTVTKESASEIQ